MVLANLLDEGSSSSDELSDINMVAELYAITHAIPICVRQDKFVGRPMSAALRENKPSCNRDRMEEKRDHIPPSPRGEQVIWKYHSVDRSALMNERLMSGMEGKKARKVKMRRRQPIGLRPCVRHMSLPVLLYRHRVYLYYYNESDSSAGCILLSVRVCFCLCTVSAPCFLGTYACHGKEASLTDSWKERHRAHQNSLSGPSFSSLVVSCAQGYCCRWTWIVMIHLQERHHDAKAEKEFKKYIVSCGTVKEEEIEVS